MVSQLLGGIGLFLLGVFLLSDGLKTAAGDALRRILIQFTGRPVTAFVSGAGITVLAQSSSATTLATIGFVSAGILTFSQAIGVVMGASLGTTSTGWLIALVGMKFGIGKLAFPLVGLGAMARLVSHGRNAAIALAVAGFGLMFAGIDIIQSAMGTLSESFLAESLPEATLWGRVLLVVIGILLTVVTQSSATAVAATLAAFHTGMIDLAQGASLVIGATIGTTSTSALAAIGATTSARRTALAHILFSVAAGIVAFATLPAFVWGVKETERLLGVQYGAVILAAFHSTFTLLTALLILPGVNRFSAFVERLVPERGPVLTRHLDSSLIEIPAVAVEAVRRTLMEVSAEILDEIGRALRGGATPVRLDRLDAASEALREARRFLGTIVFSTSGQAQLNARISIVHVLDHLNQLAIVVRNNIDASLLNREPLLLEPRRMVLEMVDRTAASLRRQEPAEECDRLQRLSPVLAENRRTIRAALLEASAEGRVEPGQALQTLDGLRSLDAIGYHTWRALHHLSTNSGDDDAKGASDEEQAEFMID